jgi:hypothetical protein
MNKKIIIYLITLILLSFNIYALTGNVCYQESFNISNQVGTDKLNCGLNYSGQTSIVNTGANSYNRAPTIDGNWGTYSEVANDGSINYHYFNYSKPNLALNTSLIQIGMHTGTGGGTLNISNSTIDPACWNYNNDTLMFMHQGGPYGGGVNALFCYNGGWLLVRQKTYTVPATGSRFYEEAMVWFFDYYNFTITLKDDYDNTNITNFTVEIDNVNYTTTTGLVSVILGKVGVDNYNISIFNATNSFGAYFNKTFLNYNVSTNLVANLSQTDIKVLGYEKITGLERTGSFWTSAGLKSYNTSIGFKAGTHNVTWLNGTYSSIYNKTSELTFTALQNATVNISGIYNQILNFTAKQIINNTGINSFNVTLTETTGYSEQQTTTNGTMSFNTIKQLNYTAYSVAVDHAIQTNTNYDYINSSANQYNKSFGLLPDKSFEIIYKDAVTNLAISTPNLTIYGGTSFFTFNNTKVISVNITTPGTYNTLIQKTGYDDSNNFLTISNYEFTNLTYYLTSDGNIKFINIKNIYNQYIEGASVSVYRYSDGVLLYNAVTDIGGQVSFSLSNSISYIIYVTADSYTTINQTWNAISDSLTITLEPLVIQNVSKYMGITYDFSPKTILVNNTATNIIFSINSSYFNISNCNMTIKDNASVVLNSTAVNFCNNVAGTKTLNVIPGNTNFLDVYATVIVNGEVFSYYNRYTVKYIYQGDFSLKTALEDIANFNQGGFDNFGRGLFVIIITILILASAIRFSPYIVDKPETVLLLLTLISAMWTITGFFDMLNSLPQTSLISNEWSITTLLSIITALSFIKSWRER